MLPIFASCRSPWLWRTGHHSSTLSSCKNLPGSVWISRKKSPTGCSFGTCILAEMVINVIVQLHLEAAQVIAQLEMENLHLRREGRPTGFRHVVKQTSCKPDLGTACPKFCRSYHNLIRLRVRGHKIWFRGGLSRSTAAHPRHVPARSKSNWLKMKHMRPLNTSWYLMVYHVLLYLASGSSGPAYMLGPLSRAVSLFHAPSKLAFYMLGCLVGLSCKEVRDWTHFI